MKKIICIFLVIISIFTFASCAKKKKADTEKDLEIQYLPAGLGVEWLDELITEFKKTDGNADKNIFYNDEINYGVFETTIKGVSVNSIDMYLGYAPYYRKIDRKYLEDLTSVYNYTNAGETKTIGEKMSGTFKAIYDEDGKYYAMPWQAIPTGIVYNHKFFAENSITIPRTTDELLKVTVRQIKAKNKTPFIHNKYNYWRYAYEGWWAQYEGVDEYFNFWNAKVGNTSPTKLAFAQQGREEAMKVLEKIVNPTYKNVVNTSNGEEHVDSQTKFLNDVAVMMPTGGWLEAEMKSMAGKDVRFLKTPIVSSIIDKCESIKDEATLLAVIDYVDKVNSTKPENVTSKDIQRIVEARNVVNTTASEMNAIIPAYTKAKNLAKDFLQFLFSDVGLKIYYKHIGSVMPYSFGSNSSYGVAGNTFRQSMFDMTQNVNWIFRANTNKLFYMNNIDAFKGMPELILGDTNSEKRQTVEEYMQNQSKYVEDNWSLWLNIAGLN